MTDQHPLFRRTTELDLPREWIDAGDCLQSEARRIVVLGAPDSGKSTFALWLAERCVQQGATVAFVDSDMGQSHVGPPTTIGLEMFRNQAQDRESHLYFVGATNPKQHLLQTLSGVRMLIDKAQQLGADKVIVDTTGLVNGGAARELKLQKINLIRPDGLVAIQRSGEVDHLLEPHKNTPGGRQFRLPISPKAQSVKRDARRKYRTDRFRDYFANAERVDIPLSQVWVQGRNFCSGDPLGGRECSAISKTLNAKMVFGHRLEQELFLVTNAAHKEELLDKVRRQLGFSFIHHMPIGEFRNLVVGLVDSSGFTLAIGLFFFINLQERKASIYTPHRASDQITMIQLGSLHVSPSGKELEWR